VYFRFFQCLLPQTRYPCPVNSTTREVRNINNFEKSIAFMREIRYNEEGMVYDVRENAGEASDTEKICKYKSVKKRHDN